MQFSASTSIPRSWSNYELNPRWYQGPSKRYYGIAHRFNSCIVELLLISLLETRRYERVRRSWPGLVPPTVTRRNFPIQTPSISKGHRTGILHLDMASTSALGHHWH